MKFSRRYEYKGDFANGRAGSVDSKFDKVVLISILQYIVHIDKNSCIRACVLKNFVTSAYNNNQDETRLINASVPIRTRKSIKQ